MTLYLEIVKIISERYINTLSEKTPRQKTEMLLECLHYASLDDPSDPLFIKPHEATPSMWTLQQKAKEFCRDHFNRRLEMAEFVI